MADLLERRPPPSIASALRSVSRWVWLLLVLAAAVVVVGESHMRRSDVSSPLFAVLPAAPLLVAAVLMGVAGHARLIRVAAVGLSIGPLVGLVQTYFSGPGYLLPAWVTEFDYAELAERMRNFTQLVQSFGWLFSLAAVLALAFYVGALRQRPGLWIVLVGALLALAQVTVYVVSLPDLEPSELMLSGRVDQLTVQVLGQLSVVGWAYFLAVAHERQMKFLSLAAGATMAGTAFSIAVSVLFRLGLPLDLQNPAFATIIWLENLVALVSFMALVGGILLELPRSRVPERMTDRAPLAQELHSPAG